MPGNRATPPEAVSKQPDIGEGGLDLGAEAPGVEAEILWLLARYGSVAESDAFDEIGGKETAFNGDADPAHAAPPVERSTKQPRMSVAYAIP